MHNYTIHPQYGSLLSSDFLLAQVLCLLKRVKNSLLVFWTIGCISSTFLTKHPILYLRHFQWYHITGKYWNTVIIRSHQQRRYYRWGQVSRDRSPAKELGWNGKGQERQQLLLVLCAGGGSRCPAHLDLLCGTRSRRTCTARGRGATGKRRGPSFQPGQREKGIPGTPLFRAAQSLCVCKS